MAVPASYQPLIAAVQRPRSATGIRRGRDGQKVDISGKPERATSLKAGKAFRGERVGEGDGEDGYYEVWWCTKW